MRLHHCTQVSQKMGLRNRALTVICGRVCCMVFVYVCQRDITARWSNLTRGLLPKRKSELQLVLEHKQREQHKQGELALHPPSDFEEKLRAMQQRIQVCELEEKKRNESLQDVPEFVRVRGTLKHVQTFSS
ncbi:hypothetical protein F2P81_012885 [Scophthalmus maximus]|uniref:Uncharacterized protein n=1 Tax=Scophthalmus maximus TaxID=52904 RepID=A0A6A4SPD9_SCOMX|nr:hypothetical protein F2P81_012885 [Scophthalmus maximus]